MAVDFIQAKKRQQYLFLILAVLIVTTLLIIWRGFFQQSVVVVLPVASGKTPEITINTEILKNNNLINLELFESVAPFQGKIGRQNPFAPY